MKRAIPILILCALLLGGCGMGGTASEKGKMDLTGSDLTITQGPTVTMTKHKDGRVETVTAPPSITARGPTAVIQDPSRVYYNWGILRLQKLFAQDALGKGLAENPPRGELKGTPEIEIEICPDGNVKARIGKSGGVSGKGQSTKVPWLSWIVSLAGVVVFGIVLAKYGPKLLALLKAGWNILAAKVPWLPAIPVADPPKTKVKK